MKNTYKAIIADFDGTLVTEDLILTDRLKQALSTLRSQGWRFSIVTGRMRTEALDILLKTLDLHDPIVFNGGAEIINPILGELLLQYTMEATTLQRLLKAFEGTEGTPFIYQDGYMYIDNLQALPSNYKYTCKPLASLELREIKKVRIVYPAGKEADMVAMLARLEHEFSDLNFGRSDSPTGPGCDITSLKATKHQAVLHLSEMLNVPPHQIIGIGDGYNDYPLLTACGYKVAIDTAPQGLQAIADKVIPSQATDGVAEFLESLIV